MEIFFKYIFNFSVPSNFVLVKYLCMIKKMRKRVKFFFMLESDIYKIFIFHSHIWLNSFPTFGLVLVHLVFCFAFHCKDLFKDCESDETI